MIEFNPNSLHPNRTLREPARAHLVGARGTGMKALSDVLVGLGWDVSGSDINLPSATTRHTIPISIGHDSSHVPFDLDVLVHSPAIDETNPEVAEAMAIGVPCFTYPEMLGELTVDRYGVAVCGTHGKSTTTALLGWILSQAGLSPSVVCGAEFVWPSVSGWVGDSDLLVVEACEYRQNFLHLDPDVVVLLGIEPDHFDCYHDVTAQTNTYAEFVSKLPEDGLLVANADCRVTRRIADNGKRRVTPFSTQGPLGWRAEDICAVETGMLFRVCHGQYFHSDILLPLFGRHQVSNALAAIAVAAELGVPAQKIQSAIETFAGLRRRFEPVGTWSGVTIVDDYAHHPSAVTATIRATRQKYPNRRVVAVFEPHQYSRTSALFDEFVIALGKADEVHIAPLFAARETIRDEQGVQLTRALAEGVEDRGVPATAQASLDQVIATLDDSLAPGDVLLTMGAGQIDRIPNEFTGRFQRYSEAG